MSSAQDAGLNQTTLSMTGKAYFGHLRAAHMDVLERGTMNPDLYTPSLY
jgi:hypothetical protein